MTLNRLSICGVALFSFAAGSLITAHLVRTDRVRADSNRVFELRIYHVTPGKTAALQARFRDKVANLFMKHDMQPVGFWVPEDAPASEDTFIYILAHPSRDAAKKHWAETIEDPDFKRDVIESEKTDKLVQKVDATYMDPTAFSALK